MTVLVATAIKVLALMAGALLASSALSRHSAALRHWILVVAVTAALGMPVLDRVSPSWTLELPAWRTLASTSALQWSSAVTPPVATRSASEPASPAPPTASSAWTIGVAIWALGAIVLIGRWGAGIYRVKQIASRAHQVRTGRLRLLVDRIAQESALRRPVRLLLCERRTVLATWGFRHPSILLPDQALDWPDARLEAVLRHELAHIRRGDAITLQLASVLSALHWFDPLVWLVQRRLRRDCEQACDDFVLSAGTSGPDYATHLLEVARETARGRQVPTPAIVASPHPSALEGRIRAMLNPRLDRRPLTGFLRLVVCAPVGVAAIFVASGTVSGSAGETVILPPAPAAFSASPTIPLLPSGRGPASVLSPTRAAAGLQTSTPGAVNHGTIEGVLYDQYGGLLPGASVTLTATTTGASRTTATDRGGAFTFRDLPPGDYELVTELIGFTRVTNLVAAEAGATVRRHITLPIGTVQETISITCNSSLPSATRPGSASASAVPGAGTASLPRGTEPRLGSTFTGGIGGQIKAPHKLADVRPACPTDTAHTPVLVRLSGRIGIDGLITDLRDVSGEPSARYSASAMDAARRWLFTPTELNGRPIEVNLQITMQYSWY